MDKAINTVYDIMKYYYRDDAKMGFIYKLDAIVSKREAPEGQLMFTVKEFRLLKKLYDNIPVI